MSDVKWIKLSTTMFEDEKIRLIEGMPEADTLLIIWIKLLSQAGKTNASGYIFLNENIPYTEEMLSTIFNRPVNTVRMALQAFRQFGMIEIDDNHFIAISNWSKHQSVDRLEEIREQNKLRKQKQRAKEKQYLLEMSHDSHVTGHGDVTDIDKELEIDKEIKNSPDAHQDHTPSENILTPSIDKQKENYDIPYEEIVIYLNENTGKSYKHTTKKTKDLIKARWNEGFVLDDFKQVIDNKVSDWLRNGEMNVYLRPETLFGTKFEGYLNEKTRKQPTIHIGAHTKQNNLTIDDQWDEV